MNSQNRIKYIERSRNLLMQKVRGIQSRMYAEMIEYYLGNIALDDDGLIKQTSANFSVNNRLSRIYDKYIKGELYRLGEWFVGRLLRIGRMNDGYYERVAGSNIDTLKKQVQAKQLNRLGYDGKKFVKGGYLYDLLNDQNPLRKIKAAAVKAIAGGYNIDQFRGVVRDTVIGESGKLGAMETHIYTAIYDSFQQHDRMVANEYAKELDLRAAIYQGPTMVTTRDFCRSKIGKVFTKEEIEKWRDQNWKGKNTPYDPFTDLGGYNCTHTLDWISEQLAVARRPELKSYYDNLRIQNNG